MSSTLFRAACLVASLAAAGPAAAVYLNDANIDVVVGPGTSAGTFNNTFDNGATIRKVIDAPSASAAEFHDQQTHIWFTANAAGGGLELLFDFRTEYDITTLHFWNYTSEDYDVDNVSFSFFNGANSFVGSLAVSPALGSSPGILAQDLALAAPLNVRYVTAFLTGSNRQVDFQNIGFTATVSTPVAPIPEPSIMASMAVGGLALAALARRRQRRAAQA